MYLMMLFNKATKNSFIVSLFIRKTNHKNNFWFLPVLFFRFGGSLIYDFSRMPSVGVRREMICLR